MGVQLRCLLWPGLLLMGRIDVPGDPLTTREDLGGGTEVCPCPHCKWNGVPVLETVCPFPVLNFLSGGFLITRSCSSVTFQF